MRYAFEVVCTISIVNIFILVIFSLLFLKEMRISGHLTCLLRNLYAGQEATVNGLVQNWERGMSSLSIITPFFKHMQNISCDMTNWINHKLKSRFLGEMSTTSDMGYESTIIQKAGLSLFPWWLGRVPRKRV